MTRTMRTGKARIKCCYIWVTPPGIGFIRDCRGNLRVGTQNCVSTQMGRNEHDCRQDRGRYGEPAPVRPPRPVPPRRIPPRGIPPRGIPPRGLPPRPVAPRGIPPVSRDPAWPRPPGGATRCWLFDTDSL